MIHVRWCIRRDLSFLLDIESQLFPEPWTEDDFQKFLRARNAIGMVAEVLNRPVGSILFALHKESVHLHRIVVHPWFHRCKIGRTMVDKLKSKLFSHGRLHVTCDAPEELLPFQLFLKSCGFVAEKCVGSTIRMRYTCSEVKA